MYYEHQVTDFFEKFANNADRNQLDPILDASAFTFSQQLDIDKQIDFKGKAKSFLRVYSYLTKIIEFKKPYYEQLWWFLKKLVPKLIIEEEDDLAKGIIETIDMDSYRPSQISTTKIELDTTPGEVEPIPVGVGGGKGELELDTLENILQVFNQRFGDIEWTDKDKVNKFLTEQLPAEMRANADLIERMKASPDRQNAKGQTDKEVEKMMQQYLFSQTEIYKKFSTDKDFQRRYKEFIFDVLLTQSKQPPINL